MRMLFVVIGVFSCLLSSVDGYGQTDRKEEVKLLMAGLDSGSSAQRTNTAKLITRSGITDEALYQKVAALLKAGYADAQEPYSVDEMSWLCKALAASGDPQYGTLLTEVAEQSPNYKLQHYARQSLDLIGEYADRNKVLGSAQSVDPEFSGEENRLAHMLKSDIVELKRDAAKLIVRKIQTNDKLYDIVAAELEKMLSEPQQDHLSSDTMAWLCKALGSSGNNKYAKTLEKVIKSTEDFSLKNHASNALKAVGG